MQLDNIFPCLMNTHFFQTPHVQFVNQAEKFQAQTMLVFQTLQSSFSATENTIDSMIQLH